ncbi:MAG: GNAT family protein [Chloroflexi bacterium]|nr:GNAT family protein [Chloroflexota bacterium]
MNQQSVVLTGDTVILRPLTHSDIGQEYLSWLNDREVTRYLGVGGSRSTIADVEKFLEKFEDSPNDLALAIIDRESDLHIGNVTLNNVSMVHRTGDTGLMIGRKDFWGRGLAFQAWALIIEHAFDQMGLRKVIAGVVDGNTASLRTLERLGFKIEGTLRKEFLVDEEPRDIYRLGLFREEFRRFDSSQPPR